MRLLPRFQSEASRTGAFRIHEGLTNCDSERPMWLGSYAILWQGHSNRSADCRCDRIYPGAIGKIRFRRRERDLSYGNIHLTKITLIISATASEKMPARGACRVRRIFTEPKYTART